MHTSSPRVWLRNDRLGICLAVFASMFCLPLVAAEEKPQLTLQFIDAETKAPLVGACIVTKILSDGDDPGGWMELPSDPLSEPEKFTPPPGQPPPPKYEHRVITDAQGTAPVPLLRPDARVAVLHEKGVAWLRKAVWRNDGAPIEVKLRPWARVEGRVLKDGKPYPGAVLTLCRDFFGSGNSSVGELYSFALCHGTAMVTDESGRFIFDRLLPTDVDNGKHTPYVIRQWLVAGATPRPGTRQNPTSILDPQSLPVGLSAWTMTPEVIGDVFLEPGQNLTLNFKTVPRRLGNVSARMIGPNGQPFTVSPDRFAGWKDRSPLFARFLMADGLTVWFGDNGDVSVVVPQSGPWAITLNSLILENLPGTVGSPALVLPNDDREQWGYVSIGDVKVQGTEALAARAPAAETPPKPALAPAVNGFFEASLRVVDFDGKPLDHVRARIRRLVSSYDGGARYLDPKGLPTPTQGKDGVIHFRIPATCPNPEDDQVDAGKTWKITRFTADLECPGYDRTATEEFEVGSHDNVAKMQWVAAIHVRVTLDGRALSLKEVSLKTSREHRADSWKEKDGVFTLPSVTPGRLLVQASYGAPDGTHWFSEAKAAEVSSPASEGLLELPLHPGVLLEGRIADDVPRPVKRRIVRVYGFASKDLEGRQEFRWSFAEPLDEGGRFAFKGLPPGPVWIAAACDGWISSEPTDAKPRLTKPPSFILPYSHVQWGEPQSMDWYPQSLQLAGDRRDLTVPMTRTGSCVLHFTQPDGSPLVDASVYWQPALVVGSYHEGFVIGGYALTRPFLWGWPGSLANDPITRDDAPGKTDAKGELRVDNLPPCKVRFAGDSLVPWNSEVGCPMERGRFSPLPFPVVIKSGETVRAEFVASP